jgi:hypothetical protein
MILMNLDSLKRNCRAYHLGFLTLKSGFEAGLAALLPHMNSSAIAQNFNKRTGETLKIGLDPSISSTDTEKLILLLPTIAIGTFSIELGMKYLIKLNGKRVPRKHHLALLFSSLPLATRTTIALAVSRKAGSSAVDFDSKLESISNYFEVWRYVQDQSTGALQTELEFITDLETLIHQLVCADNLKP